MPHNIHWQQPMPHNIHWQQLNASQYSLVTANASQYCLPSQQHASVSQGRICSDNFTSCHAEIEVADQIFYLTQSQYADTGPTSPSTDPITLGAWQGSIGVIILSHWYDSTPEKSRRKRGSNPGSSALEADALTTTPTRRFSLVTANRPTSGLSLVWAYA